MEEDVDDSIFITKLASGGVAKADGCLQLGDKLLSVSVFHWRPFSCDSHYVILERMNIM